MAKGVFSRMRQHLSSNKARRKRSWEDYEWVGEGVKTRRFGNKAKPAATTSPTAQASANRVKAAAGPKAQGLKKTVGSQKGRMKGAKANPKRTVDTTDDARAARTRAGKPATTARSGPPTRQGPRRAGSQSGNSAKQYSGRGSSAGGPIVKPERPRRTNTKGRSQQPAPAPSPPPERQKTPKGRSRGHTGKF